jgi:hypothetical protein
MQCRNSERTCNTSCAYSARRCPIALTASRAALATLSVSNTVLCSCCCCSPLVLLLLLLLLLSLYSSSCVRRTSTASICTVDSKGLGGRVTNVHNPDVATHALATASAVVGAVVVVVSVLLTDVLVVVAVGTRCSAAVKASNIWCAVVSAARAVASV